MSTLIKSLFVFLAALTCLLPSLSYGYTYDNATIHTVYQEAPRQFEVDEHGNTVGTTVSGMSFRQYSIANSYGIRLQRFEIGLAYWYVSDRGIIWADNDITALSVYLSRVV